MTVRTDAQSIRTGERFRHDALFYEGLDGFVRDVVPFIEEGVRENEPVLVAVAPKKIGRIQEALGSPAGSVRFVNMDELGQNPAHIIPAWRDFVAENAGRHQHFRGVGEPIWPGRSGAELDECHLHEALLNVAFDTGPAWSLVCPYDTGALEPHVVAEARRTHARVLRRGIVEPGESPGSSWVAGKFDRPFGEPPGRTEAIAFDSSSLGSVRRFVGQQARRSGLDFARAGDFALAAHEVAANSVRHGGGRGSVRIWEGEASVVCEVRDRGRIEDPLVGRQMPGVEDERGRGLWLANRLCDLVQVRSTADGVAVRLRSRIH